MIRDRDRPYATAIRASPLSDFAEPPLLERELPPEDLSDLAKLPDDREAQEHPLRVLEESPLSDLAEPDRVELEEAHEHPEERSLLFSDFDDEAERFELPEDVLLDFFISNAASYLSLELLAELPLLDRLLAEPLFSALPELPLPERMLDEPPLSDLLLSERTKAS